jgi:group I intron endonuclease
MSKIYKIVNDINNKVYIGKTEYTIEKRFNEHCRDAYKREEEKRPLYSAMKKYGINHFHISEIEECSSDKAAEREKYWIEFYSSYHNGYNATLGGDGKSYVDAKIILSLWEQGKTLKQIREITGHDLSIISKKLQECGIPSQDIFKRGKDSMSKKILMMDKNNQVINSFCSTREAARYLVETFHKDPKSEGGYSSHISEVCRGIRKSCLGYKWQYADNG